MNRLQRTSPLQSHDAKSFAPKSPPPPRAPPGSSRLETFATNNEIELNRSRPFNPAKQNLTRSERESIRSLMLDKSITIKPADKGGAVVVMNTSDYVIEAERQLSDTKYFRYRPLRPSHNPCQQLPGRFGTQRPNQPQGLKPTHHD